MLLDARDVPAGTVLQADVCIVGAGPAGITLALELMATRARVLLLEAGGQDGEAASWLRDVGTGAYPPLATTRRAGFGGTSLDWSSRAAWSPEGDLRCRPLEPIDFESRSWVPDSGWPFEAAHLAPFYARAGERLGLGPSPTMRSAAGEDAALIEMPRVGPTPFRFARHDVFRKLRPPLEATDNVRVLLHGRVVEIETGQSPQQVSGVRVATGCR